MTERTSFILKIIGFTAACILIALALYMTFFRKTVVTITETPSSSSDSAGNLPSAGLGTSNTGTSSSGEETDGTIDTTLPPSRIANGGATITTLLTNTTIENPTVTKDGSIAYYDPADGKFYTIDANGNVVALSQKTFPKAENITFNIGATEAVIEYPDGSNILYNFDTAQQVTIPTHWEDFSFSDDGADLVAKSIGTDESNRALVITSADGSSTKVIAALGANDDKVTANWSPDGNVVAFSATGTSSSGTFGRQEIYLIGKDGSAVGSLYVDGTSFRAIWTTDGKHILYSVADPANGYKAALWYADGRGDRNGDSRRKMGIQTTVNKCTFATSTIAYCAVPRNMPSGGGNPSMDIDEYDDVYKLDVSTGNARLVAIPAAATKMFNLSVSPDGSSLYYADGFGRLNVIRLQ
jgi:hypothetical protein